MSRSPKLKLNVDCFIHPNNDQFFCTFCQMSQIFGEKETESDGSSES